MRNIAGRQRGQSDADEDVQSRLPTDAGEISSTVSFLCSTMKGLAAEQGRISATLEQIMSDRWAGHWHPENPERGSAYRCISITDGRLDPLLREACERAGVAAETVGAALPTEFSVWTDPGQVSVRMGKSGSVWPLEQFYQDGVDADAAAQKSRALDPWAKEWMPSEGSGSSSASSSP
mmetsp:Transcript_34551/g.90497  ORF Transcript_34551/g.90497 Transcript_34551/m.90497 type:complete len:178 (-) Transcript_34551:1273-1806(-)